MHPSSHALWQPPAVSARTWALFAAVSFLWGVPYLLIKIAVDETSPLVVVAARTAVAAAVLLPLALATGALRPLRGRAWELLGLSAVQIAVPFALIPAGERWVSTSVTAILIAAEPLLVVALGAAAGAGEHVTRTGLAGLVLGLAGVGALVGLDVGRDADQLLGAGLILLAVVGYAAGVLWIRLRFAEAPPLGLATWAVTASAAMTTPLALGALPEATPSAGALAALVALGVGCTAAALVLFYRLIAEAGAVRAVLITYAAPVVAVAAGVLLLDEDLTPVMVAGMVLIAAGSWLAVGRAPRAAAADRSDSGA
jgi:drug/metabolite transporter (DMT)-like permease